MKSVAKYEIIIYWGEEAFIAEVPDVVVLGDLRSDVSVRSGDLCRARGKCGQKIYWSKSVVADGANRRFFYFVPRSLAPSATTDTR